MWRASDCAARKWRWRSWKAGEWSLSWAQLTDAPAPAAGGAAVLKHAAASTSAWRFSCGEHQWREGRGRRGGSGGEGHRAWPRAPPALVLRGCRRCGLPPVECVSRSAPGGRPPRCTRPPARPEPWPEPGHSHCEAAHRAGGILGGGGRGWGGSSAQFEPVPRRQAGREAKPRTRSWRRCSCSIWSRPDWMSDSRS